MIEALLLVILALSVTINRRERLPAFVFSWMNAVFYLVGLIVPHEYYYLSAAIFDAGCVAILYMISPLERCRLIKILMWLSFISILLNFYGLCLYHAGDRLHSYNLSFIVFYVVAALILAARSVNGRDRRWHNRIFNSHIDFVPTDREVRK